MSISFNNGEFVLGSGELNYQAVLDDFPNAKQVRIMTYNISAKNYRNDLINELKTLDETVDVMIITNIPSRMQNYYNTPAGDAYRKKYRSSYEIYLEKLNPENYPSNPFVAFNFSNHAKIIGTENIIYIGSANYSDESRNNIESGTIIRDKEFIQKIYNEVFPKIIEESTPYFEDTFNVFRLFIMSIINKLTAWLLKFDQELIFTNNKSNVRCFSCYFTFDISDLRELSYDIEETKRIYTLLENTYSNEDDEYNELIAKLENKISYEDLEWMSEFLMDDSNFYNYIIYDTEEKSAEYLQDYPEAYDENLDFYVELSMEKANEEWENLKESVEEDFLYFRDLLEKIVETLNETRAQTMPFSAKWLIDKIDNT